MQQYFLDAATWEDAIRTIYLLGQPCSWKFEENKNKIKIKSN